jgi:site-specific DNA-methyltransferase (adenine-specific)
VAYQWMMGMYVMIGFRLSDMQNLNKTVMGDITLYNNKCEDVFPSLQSESIDFIFTDPPYNCITNWSAKIGCKSNRIIDAEWFENDNLSPEQYRDFINNVFSEFYRLLKDDHGGCLFCDYKSFPLFYEELQKANFEIRTTLIWDKVNFGLGQNWRNQYEMVVVFSKGKLPFYAKKDTGNVLRYARIPNNLLHPAQKPIRLCNDILQKTTLENETILEPFAGSGSTILSCIELKRKCIAMEMVDKYYNICIDRIKGFEDYTGNRYLL